MSRIALALSLMLVAGALAVPALATEGGEVSITRPTESERVTGPILQLEAQVLAEDEADAELRWAVRTDSPDCTGGSMVGDYVGMNRDLHHDSTHDGTNFSASIEVSEWEAGYYCFVINQGAGGAGSELRDVVTFELVDDPLADFDDDEKKDCYQNNDDEECSLTTGPYTATTSTEAKEGQTARLGLRIRDDKAATAVSKACDELLDDRERLAGSVAQVLPVGFQEGHLTVSTTIPREHINEAQPRGNPHFQVCVAPDAADAGAYEADYGDLDPITFEDRDEKTGFVGPLLLEECSDDGPSACLVERQRLRGADLRLTYRLPTVDPMLR